MAVTSNPAASKGWRKASNAQPPQKAPCTMITCLDKPAPAFIKLSNLKAA
jgi:hypothetical protein